MNLITEFIIPKDYIRTDIIASIAFLRCLSPESANAKITITNNQDYIDGARSNPERVILCLGGEISFVNNNYDLKHEEHFFDDFSKMMDVDMSVFGLLYQNYGYEYVKQILHDSSDTDNIYKKVYQDIVLEIDGQNTNLTQYQRIHYEPVGFLDNLMFFIYNLFPQKYLGVIKSRWKNKTSFENRMRSILDIYINFDDITITNNIRGLCDEFIQEFNDSIRYSEKYFSSIYDENLYVEEEFRNYVKENRYDTIYFDRNIENSLVKLKYLEEKFEIYPKFLVYPDKFSEMYYVKSLDINNPLIKTAEVIDYGMELCMVANLYDAEKLIDTSRSEL